jgi:hypothetical protein
MFCVAADSRPVQAGELCRLVLKCLKFTSPAWSGKSRALRLWQAELRWNTGSSIQTAFLPHGCPHPQALQLAQNGQCGEKALCVPFFSAGLPFRSGLPMGFAPRWLAMAGAEVSNEVGKFAAPG